MRMWATRTQATALAMVASKSLARRRQRPSQAKVRSTTQRRGKHLEALGGVGALDDLDRPGPSLANEALELFAGIAAVGKEMTQPWIELADRGEDADGAVAILDVGLVHLQTDQVACRYR